MDGYVEQNNLVYIPNYGAGRCMLLAFLNAYNAGRPDQLLTFRELVWRFLSRMQYDRAGLLRCFPEMDKDVVEYLRHKNYNLDFADGVLDILAAEFRCRVNILMTCCNGIPDFCIVVKPHCKLNKPDVTLFREQDHYESLVTRGTFTEKMANESQDQRTHDGIVKHILAVFYPSSTIQQVKHKITHTLKFTLFFNFSRSFLLWRFF